MNDFTSGQLSAYCYMVRTGCKPVAMMPLKDVDFEIAKEDIQRENLKVYSEFLYEGWSTIYIYKHDYMLEVIKNCPSEPNSVYEHWILGKMFGFSDIEIGDYISKLA